MSLHADALDVLEGWRPGDAGQERLRRRYVAHLRAHPDGLARSCYPDHLTASTLVVAGDGEHVLLTLHAKAGRWFQLGGHCEAGDATLVGAARREAEEESGIAGLLLDPVPVQLSEHAVPFCDPRGGARHLDVRFAALAPGGARHAVSEESLDVRWWPATALPHAGPDAGADAGVGPEPDLVELVDLARRRLAGAGAGQDSTTSSPGGGSTSIAADQPSR